MSRDGYCLGGEQSGHIIMSKYATTGDGILTAIKISEIIADKKCKLSDLTKGFKKLPQEAESVLVNHKEHAIKNERLQNACKKIEKSLKNEGRILLRASGTENKLRVMVEAKKWEECRKYVKEIVDIIRKEDL
jgi:phosphoglucosamine mutase